MWLKINFRSQVPVYAQVVQEIKHAVARGVLKPGDKLPSVRELATELVINHNTVAKAYQELEREHVIEVIRGRGTYITLYPQAPNVALRKQKMREVILQILVEAHHLQMTDDQLFELFEQVRSEWRETGGETGGVGHQDQSSHENL